MRILFVESFDIPRRTGRLALEPIFDEPVAGPPAGPVLRAVEAPGAAGGNQRAQVSERGGDVDPAACVSFMIFS